MTIQCQPVTDLRAAAHVIGRAFQPNKLNMFVTGNQSLDLNINDFETRLVQLREEVDAHVVQSDPEMTAVAVWISPNHEYPAYPEPIPEDFRKAEAQYSALAKKHLKGRKYWHLTILARDPLNDRVTGSTSKVVRPFLERSKKENVPAMLECIDERAKLIYEYYGFETVEEVKIGVGRCDKNGNICKNGEGITAYYMIYNL